MQLINTVNPDVFRKSYTTDEKLDEVLDKIDTEEIKFSQWKRINGLAWVGHQREWQIKPPNATSGLNLQVIFMPGPHRWKALWNTSLLAKNTVKRLLMN